MKAIKRSILFVTLLSLLSTNAFSTKNLSFGKWFRLSGSSSQLNSTKQFFKIGGGALFSLCCFTALLIASSKHTKYNKTLMY
jgi:hypothetical protein